eukprot:TRINITY_DN2153_c0_g1_i4.p1 TRINITY_DN2153_c0_g1~~TRINITY_DN2153_c0_g1_i4.p1  ORF type:complete len:116 (+),score=11.14 TRINITY_DN2153_c0_g1_i4:174-521(+)
MVVDNLKEYHALTKSLTENRTNIPQYMRKAEKGIMNHNCYLCVKLCTHKGTIASIGITIIDHDGELLDTSDLYIANQSPSPVLLHSLRATVTYPIAKISVILPIVFQYRKSVLNH